MTQALTHSEWMHKKYGGPAAKPAPFDAASCADLPAALYVRNEHSCTYHAVRPATPGKPNQYITVCGKRATESGYRAYNDWIVPAVNTFADMAQYAPEHKYTENGPVWPIYVSPLACEECVRRAYGVVRCPDCLPNYSVVPAVPPTWIRSTKRGARCPKHETEYAARSATGERQSDDYVIMIHSTNRREHVRWTAHVGSGVPTTGLPTYTLCGVRAVPKYSVHDKYGFLRDVTLRYTAHNLSSFRKGTNTVCRRCETAMRKAGFATA